MHILVELVETMQNQWFSLDFAKKVSILDVLVEQITLEEGGTGKPIIMWDLPWNAIHKINSSSDMHGWYTKPETIIKRLVTKKKEISSQLSQLSELIV